MDEEIIDHNSGWVAAGHSWTSGGSDGGEAGGTAGVEDKKCGIDCAGTYGGGAMANIRKTRTDEHNFVVEVISSWLSRR